MAQQSKVCRRAHPAAGLVLAALLASALGCSSTAHLRYSPAPLEQGVTVPERDGTVARALIALTEAGEDADGTRVLRARLRLENLSDQPVALDVATIVLVAADLTAFGPPRVEPSGPTQVQPGESRTFELAFPFPEGLDLGDAAMAGLNLRWSLHCGDRVQTLASEFRRQAPPDEGWWPATFFSVGVGVSL